MTDNEYEEGIEGNTITQDPALASMFDEAFEQIATEKKKPITKEELDPESAEELGMVTEEDPEVEEEPEVEEVKEPEPKTAKEERLWQLRRERYQAIAEKEESDAKIKELQAALDMSLKSNLDLYGKDAVTSMDNAKRAVKQAIAEGDVDALVEANIALSRATHAMQESEKWKNNYDQPQTVAEQKASNISASQQAMIDDMVGDWLDANPMCDPKSRSYNKPLADQVAQYTRDLDDYLVRSGNEKAYFTPEYFSNINNYVASLNTTQKPRATIAPPRSAPATHIGGVRNGVSSAALGSKSGNATKVVLTAQEKDMAGRFGMSEAEYLKEKIEMAKTKNRNDL